MDVNLIRDSFRVKVSGFGQVIRDKFPLDGGRGYNRLMQALLSLPAAERKLYAQDCLAVLDRSPEARLAYGKDEILLLEAFAERPEPLRYGGELDIKGMIYLMRRMPNKEAATVAKGLLLLLNERPFLKRDIAGSDLSYLESFDKARFSEEGPHAINKAPRIEPQPVEELPAQYRLIPNKSSELLQYGKHEFASTQFNLPAKLAAEIRKMGDAEDATKLESTPHLTIKYGLHEADAEAIRRIAREFEPFPIFLGVTGVFSGEEFDVLKVSAKSPQLMKLNEMISRLPNTDTHPQYQPHVTIAYLKPGTGQHYSGDDSLEGKSFQAEEIVLSDPSGKMTTIPLRAKTGDLADFYARTFNDYLAEGGSVTLREQEDAAAEMVGYSVELADEFEAIRSEPIRYSAKDWDAITGERGGKGWKHVKTKQVVYGTRNPGESAMERQTERAKREHVRPETLAARLEPHAKDYPLSDGEKSSAKRAYKSLHQHHGPHLVYRINELADDLETAHKIAKDPERKKSFGKRLSSLSHMLAQHQPDKYSMMSGTSGPRPKKTGSPSSSAVRSEFEAAPVSSLHSSVPKISSSQLEILPSQQVIGASKPINQKEATKPPEKIYSAIDIDSDSTLPRLGQRTDMNPQLKSASGPWPTMPKTSYPPSTDQHPPLDVLQATAKHPEWIGSVPGTDKLTDPEATIASEHPLVHNGVNESKLVHMSNDHKAVWKPTEGESLGNTKDVPNHYGGREAASWEVSHLLGGGHQHPPTVFRELNGKHGSLQSYVPGLTNAARLPRDKAFGNSDADLSLGAYMNIVQGNLDDHFNNFGTDENGKLVKFDHGFTFPETHNTHRHSLGSLVKESGNRNLRLPPEALEGPKMWPQIEEVLRRRGMSDQAIRLTKWRIDMTAAAARRGLTWRRFVPELKSMMGD